MLSTSKAFSSIGVDDLDRAREFYGETLGLEVTSLDAGPGLLQVTVGDGRRLLIYPAPAHRPASYTVLNFPVADVDATVDELGSRGVEFERYEGFGQDEKGISRGNGPTIAWFTDPSGNVLAVLEEA